MSRPSITPKQKADKREEIREAVSRIARRRQLGSGDITGWECITIRDVIEEAGISIGTFYKYFENREDLAQSIWSEPVEILKSEMQRDYDLAKTPADKIRVLLEHYVRFSIENRRVFRGAFLLVRPDGSAKQRAVDLKDEVFYQNLCRAFREGQDLKIFKPFDAHQMAQTFWAAIHGSAALPVNLDRYDFDPPEMIAVNMIDALLDMITR